MIVRNYNLLAIFFIYVNVICAAPFAGMVASQMAKNNAGGGSTSGDGGDSDSIKVDKKDLKKFVKKEMKKNKMIVKKLFSLIKDFTKNKENPRYSDNNYIKSEIEGSVNNIFWKILANKPSSHDHYDHDGKYASANIDDLVKSRVSHYIKHEKLKKKISADREKSYERKFKKIRKILK